MYINTMYQEKPPIAQINSVIALFSRGQMQELDSVETLMKDYSDEV
jgi:hypothetical protein